MNRGLNFYGIILVTIATLVFSVNDFGVVHATTGIDLDNNPAQSNPVPDLKSDQNDNDKSSSSTSSNNNDKSSSSTSSNNNDDNNNDKSSSSTTTTTTTTTTSSNDDVPMALPFNSNMADESDDEKDYSSVIPFP
ncbi:MAG: hypothetical protein H0W19_10635 [Nitrosopumilus sp.]|nr:hypothetical protein [Nitrosopumilus sp.]